MVGGNSDIIEQAETHSVVIGGVMPRGPHQRKGEGNIPLDYGVNGRDAPTGGI